MIASVSTLVIVSLLTPPPAEADWREFIAASPDGADAMARGEDPA